MENPAHTPQQLSREEACPQMHKAHRALEGLPREALRLAECAFDSRISQRSQAGKTKKKVLRGAPLTATFSSAASSFSTSETRVAPSASIIRMSWPRQIIMPVLTAKPYTTPRIDVCQHDARYRCKDFVDVMFSLLRACTRAMQCPATVSLPWNHDLYLMPFALCNETHQDHVSNLLSCVLKADHGA